MIPFCVNHTMETPKEKAQFFLPLTQYITQNHNIENLQIVFNI
jgi:hypothetical protein